MFSAPTLHVGTCRGYWCSTGGFHSSELYDRGNNVHEGDYWIWKAYCARAHANSKMRSSSSRIPTSFPLQAYNRLYPRRDSRKPSASLFEGRNNNLLRVTKGSAVEKDDEERAWSASSAILRSTEEATNFIISKKSKQHTSAGIDDQIPRWMKLYVQCS